MYQPRVIQLDNIQAKIGKMARASPIEFKMYFKVNFETVIRGHHVYKHTWTPVMDQVLECEQDTRAEAKEYDSNAIGLYLEQRQPAAKKI